MLTEMYGRFCVTCFCLFFLVFWTLFLSAAVCLGFFLFLGGLEVGMCLGVRGESDIYGDIICDLCHRKREAW